MAELLNTNNTCRQCVVMYRLVVYIVSKHHNKYRVLETVTQNLIRYTKTQIQPNMTKVGIEIAIKTNGRIRMAISRFIF